MGIVNLITRLLVSKVASNAGKAVEILTETSKKINPITKSQDSQEYETNFETIEEIVTPELVKKVFIYTPVSNIEENLPLILNALKKQKLLDKDMVCYSLATLYVENSSFKPTKEKASKHSDKDGQAPYDYSKYDTMTSIGNTPEIDGDGEKFCGSGLIQLTGKTNYAYMDKKLGLDGGLVENGWEAGNEPHIAAAIFAQFMKDRESRIRQAIEQRDFLKMRQVVNGKVGLHWEEFRKAYLKFEKLI